MKTTLLFTVTCILALLAVPTFADGPVVSNANFLEWDYTSTIEDEFRIYCQDSPGVDITQAPVATVRAGTHEWAITGLAVGQHYCAVTAYDADGDTESAPSNEVPFVIFAAPTNARVR